MSSGGTANLISQYAASDPTHSAFESALRQKLREKKELSAAEAYAANLQRDWSTLSDECARLRDQNTEKRFCIFDLQDQIYSLTKERDSAVAKFNRARAEIVDYQDLERERKMLIESEEAGGGAGASLIHSLQEQNHNLQVRSNDLHQQNHDLHQQNQKRQEQVRNLENEKAVFEKRFKEMVSRLEVEFERAQSSGALRG